jgi:De-etiolated protein 1 Det1
MFCKEFCLFTNDKRFMILASACPSVEEVDPLEARPGALEDIPSVDDITFWVLNVESGQVVEKKTFKNDYIYLSNHSAVHLYGNNLGVVSVKYQCIHILLIKSTGELAETMKIGWHNYPDDELYLSVHKQAVEKFEKNRASLLLSSTTRQNLFVPLPPSLTSHASGNSSDVGLLYDMETANDAKPVRQTAPLSGLKQRIMSYLYRNANSSRYIHVTLEQFRTFT